MKDLFEIIDDSQKLDDRFRMLTSTSYLSAAKGEINRIYNSWDGFDKDFANQFQTTNYESRLWELYIYEFLRSHKFKIDKSQEERPDFKITNGKESVFIECVTSNARYGDRSDKMLNSLNPELGVDFTTRIGSALFSKLSKNYHELNWVKGKSLIFAIQPFHNTESFNMNVYSVVKYLYGYEILRENDDIQGVKTSFNKVANHKKDEQGILKEMPSFFDLPKSEYVSGIIFTNSATMGKFSRMGFQNGLDNGETIDIIYSGVGYDEKRTDNKPANFVHSIKDKPFDNYNYGVTFFHNPKAKFPVKDDLFFCTQCKLLNEEVFWKRMSFYPYNGKNFRVVKTNKNKSASS